MKIRIMTKKGMTLIELIISLALLGIILIPISNFVITSIKNTVTSEEKQQATFIGQKFLEELQAYDEIVLQEDKKGEKYFQLLDGDFIKEIEVKKESKNEDKKSDEYEAEEEDEKQYEGSFAANNYDVEIEIKKDKNLKNKKLNNLKSLSNDRSLILSLNNNTVSVLEKKETLDEEIDFKTTKSTNYEKELVLSIDYNLPEQEENDGEDSIEEEISKENNEKEVIITANGFEVLNYKGISKNTIMINLEKEFSKEIKIEIENNTNEIKSIYVIKNNKATGSAEVLIGNGRIILNKEMKLFEDNIEGSKFIHLVKVKKSEEILFEGSVSSNLIVR